MKESNKIKEMSAAELKAHFVDLSKEIFQLRNEQKITRKMEKPHLIRKKKKDRARVLTFLRAKEAAATE